MNPFRNYIIKQYLYYFIIGLISLLAVLFLPMLGSSADLEFVWPETAAGRAVFIVIRVIIATVNVLIFHCFMEQAKVNVSEDEHFKEANDILNRAKNKKVLPRSPDVWNRQQYLRKGTILFITSILAVVALTNAILMFDWVAMLSYIFSILFAIIFGILQMRAAEYYWTGEYYEYAIMIKGEEDNASA